jgi:hypothetical protein
MLLALCPGVPSLERSGPSSRGPVPRDHGTVMIGPSCPAGWVVMIGSLWQPQAATAYVTASNNSCK